MWRCFFTPQWRYEQLESRLSEYERKGYRLKRVYGRSLFLFEQSLPKDVTYLITYTFMHDSGMKQWDLELLHNNGIQIPTSLFTSEEYYRLPKLDCEVREFLKCRSRYLLNVFCQKIIIGLIFSITIWLNLRTLHSIPVLHYLALILLVSGVVYIGWYIIGLFLLLHSLHSRQ